MINNWIFWGAGWIFMPRMTIGIIIYHFTPYKTLGLTLSIVGGLLDITSSGTTIESRR